MKLFIKKNIFSFLSLFVLIMWSIFWILKMHMPNGVNDPIICFYITICDNMMLLMIVAPLFAIVPSIYEFHTEIHSGYIKNCLIRTSYSKYLKKMYLKCLKKSIFILPTFVIVLLIMSCIKTGNISFGSGWKYYGYYTSPPAQYGKLIFKFMGVYLFGIILNSIFYVNLGIIFSKKNSNLLVAIIFAFISFIGLDIIGECFIGGLLLAKILNIHYMQDLFNLFNVWCYDGIDNLLLVLIYYVLLILVTGVIIYFQYHNKEDVLIETEK